MDVIARTLKLEHPEIPNTGLIANEGLFALKCSSKSLVFSTGTPYTVTAQPLLQLRCNLTEVAPVSPNNRLLTKQFSSQMNELHIKHLATNVWQRVTPFAATPFALREKLARGEAELYPYSTVTVNTTLSHQTCLDMLQGGAGQSNQRLPRAVDHLLHRVRYCQRSGQMLIRCYSDYLYNSYLCKKKKKKTSTAFSLAKVKYRNQLFALRIICVGMCRRR